MDIVNLITSGFGNGIGPADIVGILSALAMFLPPTYRPIAGIIVKLINAGALNFLWARNEAKPGDPMRRPKSGRHVGG